MSTKALKRELMAAVVMVLVAAIALSGSTYAWFVNNNQVSASGLQAQAKTDNAFLLILEGNKTYAQVQAASQTAINLNVSGSAAKLYPAAITTGALTTSGALVTTSAWYTAYAKQGGSYAMDASTEQPLTTFSGFVIHKQVTLSVRPTSNPVQNLYAKATIERVGNAGNINAQRVVVASTKAAVEFTSSSSIFVKTDLLGGGQITSQSAVLLDVFIYIDGNHETIYTDGMSALATANITLDFICDPVVE